MSALASPKNSANLGVLRVDMSCHTTGDRPQIGILHGS